jgi:excisionase family DNA binding protein
MNEERMDDLISVKEAARACHRNTETIRRWIWSGKLPAVKLGNQLFIKKNTFQNYCRETAVRYDAGKPSATIERIEPPFRSTRLRRERDLTTNELFNELDQTTRVQMNKNADRLPGEKAAKYRFSHSDDLLQQVKETRNKIFARSGIYFDTSDELNIMRQEREDELHRLY